MAPTRDPGQGQLGPCVRQCKQVVEAIQSGAKAACMYQNECMRIAKFCKRLVPLFEDIEEDASTIQGAALARSHSRMKEILSALTRCEAVVGACSTMGPCMAALKEEDTMAEFVNGICDLSEALAALDLNDVKVDPDQAEGLALTLQQMQRIDISAASGNAQACIQQIRSLCEKVRNGSMKSVSLKDAPLLEERLSMCSVSQVAADADFCRERLQQAKQKRNHVEAWMFQLVLDLEEPLLPKDAKTARLMSSQKVVVPDKPSAAKEAQQEAESGEAVDPVPIVHTLLDAVAQPNLTMEHRAQALQPLVAAAGLAPPVPDSLLHHGAVMFAMTDAGCSRKVVSLLRERSTEPLIKGWLLALLLSLIHPEKGLNPRTQQALMDADIVSILCRMLSCSTTDGTQKLQCLHMLRVLVHDPSTHEAMVQAKAVHVIVQQVSSVVVSKGLVQEDKKSSVSTPLASPQKGHPKQQQQFQRQLNDGEEGGDWDMDLEQQRVELAVLMLMDMAPGPHKAEILRTGGVLALVQKLVDPTSHERVRAAAADTLAVLFDDGSIAVQASRYDALAALTDLAASPSSSPTLRNCALRAITVMLTPTPPSTAATAEAVLAAARSHAVAPLPPQGKAARLVKPGEHPPPPPPSAGAAQGLINPPRPKGKDSTQQGPPHTSSSNSSSQMSAEDLFQEMGRTLSPKSTTALMALLEMAATTDIEEIRLLVLKFLPLTATDAACRAAILNHEGGLPMLLRAAGRRHAAAICALRRVAADYKLKTKCATVMAEALVEACNRASADRSSGSASALESACNLALALASVGALAPGVERDRAALASQQAFTTEVINAGGAAPLAKLLKDPSDLLAQRAAILALRQLAMFGDSKVKTAIVEADTLGCLVDAVKRNEADWKTPPARDDGYDRDLPPDPPVFQAACDTLAGLATDPSVRQQVLAMLAPLLTQTTMVPQACQAMLVVAGSDAKAHEHLVQPALDPLLHLMKTAPPDMLTQPTRLLAAMVMNNTRAADLAARGGSSAAAQNGGGPAKSSSSSGSKAQPPVAAAAAGACHNDVLPRVMDLASEGVARAAAAAAAGHLAKRDAQSREDLGQGGLRLLLGVTQSIAPDSPYFTEACAGVAAMACLHEHSRSEVVRAVRNMLLNAKTVGPNAAAAGARICKAMSHSPQGRSLLFKEELLDGLIKTLTTSESPDAQCFAADALTHATSSGPITHTTPPPISSSTAQMQQSQQHPVRGSSAMGQANSADASMVPKPRLVIINKGAVVPLLQMLGSPQERVIYEAAFALESLACIEEGATAVKRADGARQLNEVVKRAKKGELSERTQKAAYAAYVKVM
uniref:Vacuolar protein 8 n=3 Tax=Dunaliella tertiolecta TaxID=3047 RepID=A0A7S3R5R0_DUNTE